MKTSRVPKLPPAAARSPPPAKITVPIYINQVDSYLGILALKSDASGPKLDDEVFQSILNFTLDRLNKATDVGLDQVVSEFRCSDVWNLERFASSFVHSPTSLLQCTALQLASMVVWLSHFSRVSDKFVEQLEFVAPDGHFVSRAVTGLLAILSDREKDSVCQSTAVSCLSLLLKYHSMKESILTEQNSRQLIKLCFSKLVYPTEGGPNHLPWQAETALCRLGIINLLQIEVIQSSSAANEEVIAFTSKWWSRLQDTSHAKNVTSNDIPFIRNVLQCLTDLFTYSSQACEWIVGCCSRESFTFLEAYVMCDDVRAAFSASRLMSLILSRLVALESPSQVSLDSSPPAPLWVRAELERLYVQLMNRLGEKQESGVLADSTNRPQRKLSNPKTSKERKSTQMSEREREALFIGYVSLIWNCLECVPHHADSKPLDLNLASHITSLSAVVSFLAITHEEMLVWGACSDSPVLVGVEQALLDAALSIQYLKHLQAEQNIGRRHSLRRISSVRPSTDDPIVDKRRLSKRKSFKEESVQSQPNLELVCKLCRKERENSSSFSVSSSVTTDRRDFMINSILRQCPNLAEITDGKAFSQDGYVDVDSMMLEGLEAAGLLSQIISDRSSILEPQPVPEHDRFSNASSAASLTSPPIRRLRPNASPMIQCTQRSATAKRLLQSSTASSITMGISMAESGAVDDSIRQYKSIEVAANEKSTDTQREPSDLESTCNSEDIMLEHMNLYETNHLEDHCEEYLRNRPSSPGLVQSTAVSRHTPAEEINPNSLSSISMYAGSDSQLELDVDGDGNECEQVACEISVKENLGSRFMSEGLVTCADTIDQESALHHDDTNAPTLYHSHVASTAVQGPFVCTESISDSADFSFAPRANVGQQFLDSEALRAEILKLQCQLSQAESTAQKFEALSAQFRAEAEQCRSALDPLRQNHHKLQVETSGMKAVIASDEAIQFELRQALQMAEQRYQQQSLRVEELERINSLQEAALQEAWKQLADVTKSESKQEEVELSNQSRLKELEELSLNQCMKLQAANNTIVRLEGEAQVMRNHSSEMSVNLLKCSDELREVKEHLSTERVENDGLRKQLTWIHDEKDRMSKDLQVWCERFDAQCRELAASKLFSEGLEADTRQLKSTVEAITAEQESNVKLIASLRHDLRQAHTRSKEAEQALEQRICSFAQMEDRLRADIESYAKQKEELARDLTKNKELIAMINRLSAVKSIE